jgi:hypothetical protein
MPQRKLLIHNEQSSTLRPTARSTASARAYSFAENRKLHPDLILEHTKEKLLVELKIEIEA